MNANESKNKTGKTKDSRLNFGVELFIFLGVFLHLQGEFEIRKKMRSQNG